MFDIKQIRNAIELQYIGFNPNTAKIKPAHLANGLFRVMLSYRYDTTRLLQFVYTPLKEGNPLRGCEPQTIYDQLVTAKHINPRDVSLPQVSALRSALRKIVTADNAVYPGMDSYSAGAAPFVSNDHIGQDAGEFLALWLQRDAPRFRDTILSALMQLTDPITVTATPLFDEDVPKPVVVKGADTILAFGDTCPPTLQRGMGTLAIAAEQLAVHMNAHPNKLARLRMAMLLSSFLVVRYLVDLEALFTPSTSRARPIFLLDFSSANNTPIRAASQRSYIFACQAMTRFYTWMFAQYLRDRYTLEDLAQVPTYGTKMKSAERQVIADVWQGANDDQRDAPDPYRVYGQAVYDIIVLLSEAPILYMRQIGIRGGLFWPPYGLQPTKQMAPRQDMLEVLIRSVCCQGEILTLGQIQDRLWQTFGIIIGGRAEDLDLLVSAGIYQADSQALEHNQASFVQQLSDLSFARLLADGVLNVQVGTAWN